MTPQIAQSIATALDTYPFKDGDWLTATSNAQNALRGITHYCEPANLRYHHSRIVGACVVSCGAFFKITETCAQDYQNTRRGYRVVLFDLAGTVVYRLSLNELTRTREQADKAFYAWFDQFDELSHYRDKISNKADKLARQIAVLNEVGRILAAEQNAEVAA